MVLKTGDFIELDYTGRLKENNAVFDTTNVELAKTSGIFSPKTHYGSIIICLGEGMLLRGLDTNLVGKGIGKHTVPLGPTEAFGNKDVKHIQMIPASKFKEQNIQPYPGLQLNIDGMIGTIKTAGGGRILVDFNHPLAGKDVVYEVDVKRVVTDKAEQIKTLLHSGFSIHVENLEINADSATITLKQDMPSEIAETINKKIIALCDVKAVAWKKEGA
ncbi:peptidylprolyl isomerase [Candidatus Woesearchaeota archaeon]|nr:peptidylprolyl isomerase [Candidatus Woesearchaeota archaeon]